MKKKKPRMLKILFSPFTALWKLINGVLLIAQKFMLLLGLAVFCLTAVFSWWYLMPLFDNVAGKGTSYALKGSAGVMLPFVPWWAYLIFLGIMVYLWTRHKILVPALIGVGVGVVGLILFV